MSDLSLEQINQQLEEFDFTVKNELGRGSSSVVYKGIHKKDKKNYAIKVQKTEQNLGSADEMRLRFTREAIALAQMKNPNIIEISSIFESQGRSFLIMEFVDGQSLDSLIKSGPLGEAQIVSIAKGVASALSEAHALGVVHRDIKPHNMLLAGDAQQTPKLIDFGFIAQQTQKSEENGQFVGTFLYSSPEQMGMLKRPVDGRSDLYSLGVVLYECATGFVPFQSNDVGALAHKHLNEKPASIEEKNSKISKGLQSIIYKLLEKEPDDRYQTAYGLIQDLSHLAQINQELSANKPAMLGLSDRLDAINLQMPFVGRDAELKQLLNQWESALKGKGSVVLVEGDPGMGKSRLLRELTKRAKELSGDGKSLILMGKAVAGDPLPLAPIRECIDGYIRQVFSKPPEERKQVEGKLQKMIGEFAPVLKSFSPLMAKLLADTPVTDETFSQEVYQNAIVEFIVRLARMHSTTATIVLIDDIQWADGLTNDILKRLSVYALHEKILIAGTSRNDSSSQDKLNKFVHDMKALEAISAHIKLEALSESAVANFVAAKLKSNNVEEKICHQLFIKSNGNPFATEEYLRAMLDAGFLKPHWGSWVIDEQMANRLELPGDVIHLVVSRLQNLSAVSRLIFQYAAIFGSTFETKLLLKISNHTAEEINIAITEATQYHLIERQEGDSYHFVHDRVKEALISELSEQDLRTMNQKIAEALDVIYKSNESDDETLLYSLARHYANGFVEKNPKRVFEITYLAGLESSKNYANEEAFVLLNSANQLAAKYKIVTSAEFDEALGQVCMLTFRLKDANEYFKLAVTKTTDKVNRSMLMGQMAYALFNGWEIEGAWKQVNVALKELGAPLPQSTFMRIMTSMMYGMVGEILRAFKIKFNEKNKEKLRFRTTLVTLLNMASEIAVYKHPLLLPIPCLRVVYHALFLKESVLTARSYATYAMFLESFQMPGPAKKYNDKSMQIAQGFNNRTQMAENNYLKAVGYAVVGNIKDLEVTAKTIAEKYVQWINPRQYFDMLFTIGWIYQLRGQTQKAIKNSEELLVKSKSVKNSSAVYEYYTPAYYGVLLVMKGRVKEGLSMINWQYEPLKKLDPNPTLGGDVLASFIASYLETEEFGQDFEDKIAEVKKLAPNPMFSFFPLKNAYIALCYARLSQYTKAVNAKKQDEAELRYTQVKEALSLLKQAVQKSVFYKPHVLVVEAALKSLKGFNKKSMILLEEAENLAIQDANNYALYEVYRWKARLLKEAKQSAPSQEKARQALNVASQNGWVSRIKWIKDEFSIGENDLSGSSSASRAMSSETTVSQTTTGSFKEALFMKKHLDSLLQVTLASSQEFDPQKQIIIALDETINVMGADRAFVFLKNEKSDELSFAGGRSSDNTSVELPKGYSTTVVRKVAETKAPLVLTGTEEGEAIGSESAVIHNLRSIMAVPLTLRDEFKGVLYIDSQLAKGIFTKEDSGILSGIANHITIAFETTRLANIEAQKRAMQKDLELSAAVQNFLLPAQSNDKSNFYELEGFYRSASSCSGDWWWFEKSKENGSVFMFVGDVTGHGAGPAMITAMVASNFMSMRRSGKEQNNMQFILTDMSDQLANLAKQAYLMSAFSLHIDFENKKMSCFSAGGPQPMLLNKNGDLEFISLSGSPLGSVESKVETMSRDINSGDRIFLYTDGIVEVTQASNGRLFGEKKLSALFKKYSSLNPKEAVKAIIEEIDIIRGEGEQDDDYTLIICDIT